MNTNLAEEKINGNGDSGGEKLHPEMENMTEKYKVSVFSLGIAEIPVLSWVIGPYSPGDIVEQLKKYRAANDDHF